MHIKEVAELTGVSTDTIRYYERIGLLPPISRDRSGNRQFTDRDVSILTFVRCFRKAGLGVEALIDYISLLQQGDATIEARLAILLEQRDVLGSKMSQLNQALERLNYKIDNYQSQVFPREQLLFDEGGRHDKT